MVSTCHKPITKECNWQILNMTFIPYCHGLAACTYQISASSSTTFWLRIVNLKSNAWSTKVLCTCYSPLTMSITNKNQYVIYALLSLPGRRHLTALCSKQSKGRKYVCKIWKTYETKQKIAEDAILLIWACFKDIVILFTHCTPIT